MTLPDDAPAPPDAADDVDPAAFAAEVERLLAPQLDALRATLPGLAAAPDDLAARLAGFCAGLRAANATINLTGLTSAEDMVFGHVVDSLLALPLVGDAGVLLDLGSGCGVPGVPLALAQPERTVRLCESRVRKSEALGGLVRGLGLAPRIDVVNERAETWLVEQRVDTVVARAVGRVGKLLELLGPVRHGFRRLVLLKGPGVDAELEEIEPLLPTLGFAPKQRVDTALPDGRGARVLLVFEPLRRGPRGGKRGERRGAAGGRQGGGARGQGGRGGPAKRDGPAGRGGKGGPHERGDSRGGGPAKRGGPNKRGGPKKGARRPG